MLGFGAFLYATFIAISSMAVSVFFETQLGMIELAYAIVLIVFCGGGLGLIGWVKQKYNAPLVSVACSLASLAIITVLTKENAVHVGVFEDDKIVQVMKMYVVQVDQDQIVIAIRSKFGVMCIQLSDTRNRLTNFSLLIGSFLELSRLLP